MITTATFLPTTRAQARRLGAISPKVMLPDGVKQARGVVGDFLLKLQRRPDLDPFPFFGASASNDVAEPTLRPGYDDATGASTNEVIWPFTEYKAAWAAWKTLAGAIGVQAPFPPTDARYRTVREVKAAMVMCLASFDKRFNPTRLLPTGLLFAGLGIGLAFAILRKR